jgi:hypothetical protein
VYNSTNSVARSLNVHKWIISEYFNRIKNCSTKSYKGRYIFKTVVRKLGFTFLMFQKKTL